MESLLVFLPRSLGGGFVTNKRVRGAYVGKMINACSTKGFASGKERNYAESIAGKGKYLKGKRNKTNNSDHRVSSYRLQLPSTS